MFGFVYGPLFILFIPTILLGDTCLLQSTLNHVPIRTNYSCAGFLGATPLIRLFRGGNVVGIMSHARTGYYAKAHSEQLGFKGVWIIRQAGH